jgi:cytochrome c peroxidase
LTDEDFHVLAVPQIGRGKKDGLTRTDDFGRFRETRQLKDLYAFRTPSLINVTVTGPWGHDGAYASLEAMVRHNLNPAEAIAAYPWDEIDDYVADDYAVVNTRKALARLEYNRRQGLDTVENVDLTDAEVADLMAFIEALTDPCVTDEACLAPWMPADDELDPDGKRLDAYLALSSE